MSFRIFAPLAACCLILAGAFVHSQERAPEPKQQLRIFKFQQLTAQEALYGAQTIASVRALKPDAGPNPSIAVDQRAQALFFRGTEPQIAEVEQFLLAADKPVDKLTEAKLPSLDLLPMKHGDIRVAANVLAQLKITTQVVAIGKGGLLVISNQDPQWVVEAREVIKSLDVPETPKTVAAE